MHYHRHCYYCHGDSVKSGGVIQDLRYSQNTDKDTWKSIVIDGVLTPAGMVSFKEYITEEEAEAIRQYTLSQANKTYAKRTSR